MTQEEAFVAQARSDYCVFELLQLADRTAVPECHVLHYYQMATEKVAKALLARQGRQVGKTHVAFSYVAGILQKAPKVLQAIGYRNPARVAGFLSRARPLLRQIEELSPAVAGDGPNAEYPWPQTHPNAGQQWLAPAAQTFAAFQTISGRSGDARTMLKLVKYLLDHYERIP